MEDQTSSESKRNDVGKWVVVALYVFFVFISPLWFLTPIGQEGVSTLENLVLSQVDKPFLRDYVSLLKEERLEEAEVLLTPEARERLDRSQLSLVVDSLASTTGEVEIVGGNFRSNSTNGGEWTSNYYALYELKNDGAANEYMLVSIWAEEKGGIFKVVGVDVSPQQKSAKEVGGIDFASPQVLYLLGALLVPIFVLFTAVKYIRSSPKFSWLMFIAILFLSAYPTITPTSWNLSFGAYGFMSPAGWGTWLFALPVPLGAAYYYLSRFFKRKTPTIQPPTQPVSVG